MTTVYLCAALYLGGCKEYSFLQSKAPPPPAAETHSFQGDLANEYQALAEFAMEQESSPQLAGEFYGKAEQSAQGYDVAPESLEKYRIPPFAVHDLTQARNELVQALNTANTPANARMLAMAQVKFDCWLAYQPYQKREGSYIGCRESFRQAMANVDLSEQMIARAEAPAPMLEGPQTIHFGDEKMTLDQASHDMIAALAEQALATDNTIVLLVGHSKTSAHIEDTSNNSVRRIIAVRNALYQNGIDPDFIEIEFEKSGSPLDVDIELHPGAAASNS
jgi:outer membrane protein OmpA-like peptidoglycan-associated protein